MPRLVYATAASAVAVYIGSRLYPSSPGAVYLLISLAWALYAVYAVFIYPFVFSPFRNIPEPKGASFPWAHAQFIKSENNGEPFRRWVNDPSIHHDGLIRYRVLFNEERLLLVSPAAIKEVFVTKANEFVKPALPAFMLRSLLGNGVLIAEGADHQHQRKALQPAFSFRHIKDLVPLFWSKGKQSTDEISKANKTAFATVGRLIEQPAYDWASRATLDIIGEAGMGYDFNSVRDPNTEILKTYRALFDSDPPHFRWTSMGIALPMKYIFWMPLPMFDLIKTSSRAVRAFCLERVREKRDALKKDAGEGKIVDVLSVAMRSGQFEDEDVVDQMMTFLAAGHETTSSALTWAIYQLCLHPEIQERLREEIRASLPAISDPTSTVTSSDIDQLPYLNAVCNEVLRFIPSVPMTMREAIVDTTIQGHVIPKGTRVVGSPWATNQSLDLWGATASEFDPERWMAPGATNSGGAQSNFANLTFLHGPRSCIGKDFAKAEFMCLLAAWIGRFRVSWKDGEALPMDILGWVTVRPKHKLPVVFEEVEGW